MNVAWGGRKTFQLMRFVMDLRDQALWLENALFAGQNSQVSKVELFHVLGLLVLEHTVILLTLNI